VEYGRLLHEVVRDGAPLVGKLSVGVFIRAVDNVRCAVENIAMTLTAVLTPAPEGGYVALNPETGSTTQGETVDEALANLKEATELYLEEFPIAQSGNSLFTTIEVGSRG
jgi:predicted RNase H-like HicB family nuclease